MQIALHIIALIFMLVAGSLPPFVAQDRKLERIRIGEDFIIFAS